MKVDLLSLVTVTHRLRICFAEHTQFHLIEITRIISERTHQFL